MSYLEEALDAYLDYEAFTNGFADETMTEEQGLRFENMAEGDPDLPFFTAVRRLRLEREADMRFHIAWCLQEKLDEIVPVSYVDIEREEDELTSRVRKLDFADYKDDLRQLQADRRLYIAEKMQSSGIMLPVLSAEERAGMIKNHSSEWQMKLLQAKHATRIFQL